MSSECGGKCDSCSKASTCSDPRKEEWEDEQRLKQNLSKIKHKIAIISGKGGVGKSTVTVNLAMAFAMQGHVDRVGILDVDIHGPSIPKMLGLKGERLQALPAGLVFPVVGPLGIRVVSMDFLLPSDEVPVIWRGPMKMRAIKQFLSDITWGDLDYLFIDLPPGTGDEPLSVVQFMQNIDGVVIVTIPSEVSQVVVKKAVTFARELKVPVIGIVENMSGFVCPNCGSEVDIFKVGGGQRISEELGVPFLGKIPIDPRICEDSDKGVPFIVGHADSPAARAFMEIVEKIDRFLNSSSKDTSSNQESN
ncbi:MAG: Mrp/NBP35 family ATP-binding protein [Candidatus Nezhaarchaeota archaeon]|nr:Mrp/NBP35 family ATP-binding protein [Candidatus Nezhaarchaeota archaeon]